MSEAASFDASFFAGLARAERDHFWFRVRRAWIADLARRALPPPARLLEVGCGTGNVAAGLARAGYAVTGCDPFAEGLAAAWPGFARVRAGALALPFREGAFDAAGLFDVVEHLDDDAAALREAARVVRPGGVLLVTVPAGEGLWSWVDEASHHRRRYSPASLRAALAAAGLAALEVRPLFCALALPMRLARRRRGRVEDLFRVGRAANAAAAAWFHGERVLSRALPLPAGTSLFATARVNAW